VLEVDGTGSSPQATVVGKSRASSRQCACMGASGAKG
jgi:hypothetical protein